MSHRRMKKLPSSQEYADSSGPARSEETIFYYIGSAEGHEYTDLQVGDEVNPRPFFMPL